MLTGILHLHSLFAVLVIIGLVLSIVSAFKPVNASLRKVAKIAMMLLHTQFLIGLILYFVSPKGFASFSSVNMSEAPLRLFFLEHPFVGLIAVALVTIGHAKLKRLADGVSAKPILIFYTLGLLAILSRFPFQYWSWFN